MCIVVVVVVVVVPLDLASVAIEYFPMKDVFIESENDTEGTQYVCGFE